MLMRTVPCTFLSAAGTGSNDVPHLLPLLDDAPGAANLASLLADDGKGVFLAS